MTSEKKPRKLRVGSLRLPAHLVPPRPAGERPRDVIVRRARRIYQGLAPGASAPVDVDESVRRGPPSPAPRPGLLGGRRSFLTRRFGEDDDDVE